MSNCVKAISLSPSIATYLRTYVPAMDNQNGLKPNFSPSWGWSFWMGAMFSGPSITWRTESFLLCKVTSCLGGRSPLKIFTQKPVKSFCVSPADHCNTVLDVISLLKLSLYTLTVKRDQNQFLISLLLRSSYLFRHATLIRKQVCHVMCRNASVVRHCVTQFKILKIVTVSLAERRLAWHTHVNYLFWEAFVFPGWIPSSECSDQEFLIFWR